MKQIGHADAVSALLLMLRDFADTTDRRSAATAMG
jgi:hypothetical protein